MDRTNRSRFGQIGSVGSKRRNCCHKLYTTGASAIGVPGCPELACWTASMASVRMVLIESCSIEEDVVIRPPFVPIGYSKLEIVESNAELLRKDRRCGESGHR